MKTTLMKQSVLFRKCADYFQDHSELYRNRGYNAIAGQGLWEDGNQILYKLSVVNDVSRGEFYVLLQMGKKESEPSKAIIRNISGLKSFIAKYHLGQAKLVAFMEKQRK